MHAKNIHRLLGGIVFGFLFGSRSAGTAMLLTFCSASGMSISSFIELLGLKLSILLIKSY